MSICKAVSVVNETVPARQCMGSKIQRAKREYRVHVYHLGFSESSQKRRIVWKLYVGCDWKILG